MLAYDASSTASIAATMAAARESARRARKTLSTSMWEAMNTTYRAIGSGQLSLDATTGRFPGGCATVRPRYRRDRRGRR